MTPLEIAECLSVGGTLVRLVRALWRRRRRANQSNCLPAELNCASCCGPGGVWAILHNLPPGVMVRYQGQHGGTLLAWRTAPQSGADQK